MKHKNENIIKLNTKTGGVESNVNINCKEKQMEPEVSCNTLHFQASIKLHVFLKNQFNSLCLQKVKKKPVNLKIKSRPQPLEC